MNKTQLNLQSNNPCNNHPEDSIIYLKTDCSGCQAERRQNSMLVDFYERLTKIENKVGKIRENVGTQKQVELTQKQKIEQIQTILINKPEQVIQQIKQQNSQDMGYELALALIERDLKVKMENQRLQELVCQLQKDKLRLEEQKRQSQLASSKHSLDNTLAPTQKSRELLPKGDSSHYSDAIDEVRRTNSIEGGSFGKRKGSKVTQNSYFLDSEDNKKYWETAEGGTQTNFSSFTVSPNKRVREQKVHQKNRYEGLNLWLYQYKATEVQQPPIKSLRRPVQKLNYSNENKYRSKF